MREQLCHLLALHAGKTIDMPLAAEMVRALFPDNSHEPDQFGQKAYQNYVFRCERMADVLPELHLLHELHWQETEKYRAGLAMDPDYAGMKEAERAGGMIQFTARVKETGELVGNMRVNIGRSTHTQTLFCTEDTFFVRADHRGGFMAVRLWQFVESCVRSIGVREVRFTSKLVNGADRMAKYLKYEPVGLMHVKIFD